MAKIVVTQEQAEQLGYLASAVGPQAGSMELSGPGEGEHESTVSLRFTGGSRDGTYRVNTIGEVEYRPGKEQPNG